ncbi:MAG: hypothetical protein JWR88_908 [Pseudonocardia sp.]|nr:hypothetical protein [Pseudonocardia sp.]
MLIGPKDAEHAECLELWGLDDAVLDRLARAERLIVSLPHASPNIFFPRVGIGWYARHLQDRESSAVHLRIALPHVNFADLGWRPYAWWLLDAEGHLVRQTLFTRNKKAKHTVVGSQPALLEVPEHACGVDREAARLALRAADRAGSYLLIMATVERAAGLAMPGRTVYLPLDLVVRFFRDAQERPEAQDYMPWVAELLATGAGARRLTCEGRLEPAADPWQAYVLDNPSNIALLSLLSSAAIIGGAKMAGYWGEVEHRVATATATSGVIASPPAMLRLPKADYPRFVAPSSALAEELATAGIGYSQGMALSEHGDFVARLNPFA